MSCYLFPNIFQFKIFNGGNHNQKFNVNVYTDYTIVERNIFFLKVHIEINIVYKHCRVYRSGPKFMTSYLKYYLKYT